MPTYVLIPLVILASLVVLMALVVFLGRFRNGKYLRPVITTLAKIPFMRRLFQKVSTAALERQNPELVSVMRKLERAGASKDPAKAQQVIHQLNPAERRAFNEYTEMVRESGEEPVATNRQLRRMQQRQFGQPRSSGSSSGSSGSSSSKKRKKR